LTEFNGNKTNLQLWQNPKETYFEFFEVYPLQREHESENNFKETLFPQAYCKYSE
jgi:hypothetical protein